MVLQIVDNRSLQAWPSYQLVESKLDRNSNF